MTIYRDKQTIMCKLILYFHEMYLIILFFETLLCRLIHISFSASFVVVFIVSVHWGWRVRVMVFNATCNNISVLLWRSVLLVEETGENHQPAASHWQSLSHNVVSSIPCPSRIQTHNVSGDRQCKSNYHTKTTKTAPTGAQSFNMLQWGKF